MAHMFESGAFVRAGAWHGLGNVIGEAPKTGAEMSVAAGLDWLVVKQALYRKLESGELEDVTQVALTRDSDGRILGFADKSYVPFQNSYGFEFFQQFVDSGMYEYETAGSLCGGRQCWVLLKLNHGEGEYEVVPGDPIREYMLGTWGHDGCHGIKTRLTSIRVVCKNTLNLALDTSDDSTFNFGTIRHSTKAKDVLEKIGDQYMNALARFRGQKEWFQRLLERPVTPPEKRGFINELIPIVDETTERTQNSIVRIRSFIGEMAEGMVAGSSMVEMPAGIRDTAYGLLMATTEANEHYLGGNRVKDRGANILDGTGAKRNARAEALMNTLLAQPVGRAFVGAN